MAEFVKVAKKSDIPNGRPIHVSAKGKDIMLTNIDGKFYAIDDLCSHESGPLHEGSIHYGVVTCPLHGSEFDVKTGKIVNVPFDQNQWGKVSDQNSYEVKVEDEDVFVKV